MPTPQQRLWPSGCGTHVTPARSTTAIKVEAIDQIDLSDTAILDAA